MTAQQQHLRSECDKAIQHFKRDLARLRSGRAHTSLLDGIMVDYYGSQVPILQLGMINAPEPRLLTVQIYDRGAVEAVEKAIQHSDLGLNPMKEGNLLRIAIPSLTEERRKELIKKVHKMAEDTKVSLRNHRRDELDNLKKQEKDKTISSDDLRRSTEEVQKIIDKFSADVDLMVTAKEKEMMEV